MRTLTTRWRARRRQAWRIAADLAQIREGQTATELACMFLLAIQPTDRALAGWCIWSGEGGGRP